MNITKNVKQSVFMPDKKIFYLFILFFYYMVQASSLEAEEKNGYSNILLLGINQPVSNSEVNTPSPLLIYNYIRDDFSDGSYFQFTIRTTRFFLILGKKDENYFAGVKPLLNHTIYSAYHSYQDGVNDDSRCFTGNNAGAEFFYEYSPVKFFTAGISYYPGYYWYHKKKDNDSYFFRQDATEIGLPENHWEHNVAVNVTLDKSEEKDIGRIKHGFILRGTYEYICRSGYGTFYDTDTAENSSIDKTQKRYIMAGFYYNLSNDINLLLDISGGYHTDVDRNNADQIGSLIAVKGIMPGYFWGEFYHNKFCIVKTQIGVPLFFWSARLQPGFNILYMPEDNDVAGADNYPRIIYRSISAGLSFKAAGILPVFADYAYGMDARRLNTDTGVEKKGNHEFNLYAVAAF